MWEIRTSGSMSGDGKPSGDFVATAPVLDSTEFRGPTASEPDFMQCLAQFQVPYKNDSVSNGLPRQWRRTRIFAGLGKIPLYS
jgi:hypothetical protein